MDFSLDFLHSLLEAYEKYTVMAKKLNDVEKILLNTNITGEQLRFEISRVLEIKHEQTSSSGKV